MYISTIASYMITTLERLIYFDYLFMIFIIILCGWARHIKMYKLKKVVFIFWEYIICTYQNINNILLSKIRRQPFYFFPSPILLL